MKTVHTAQQLLFSMYDHEDIERFISDCWDKADRVVEEGINDTTTSIIFHFLDSSRIHLYPERKHISLYCPLD